MKKLYFSSAGFLWTAKLSLVLQIVIVFFPSLLLLKAGELLLLGVFLGTSLATIFIKLRGHTWSLYGLKKTENTARLLIIIFLCSILILIVSYFLRKTISWLINQNPRLDVFNPINGNPRAYVAGLTVAWIFGAFGEELLFRGFTLNTIFNILPGNFLKTWLRWFFALLITSFLTGIGHLYQGYAGMILAGIIGFFFGLVYLFAQRNLWVSIIAHGIYDSIAITLLFIGLSFDQILQKS